MRTPLAVGIIPARYQSTRFPGKPLVSILGKPMIIWVCEATATTLGKKNTYVATDSITIKDEVESYGYNVIMTSEKCLTGTDRVAEASRHILADVYLNIQGDEPMIEPRDIRHILNQKMKFPNHVVNGKKIISNEDVNDRNLIKVVCNADDELIYMSRLPVPGTKGDGRINPIYYKQICLYAYSKAELAAFYANVKADYERAEDIEILRFFNLGIRVKMIETFRDTIAVDIPSDVKKVEMAMINKQKLNLL